MKKRLTIILLMVTVFLLMTVGPSFAQSNVEVSEVRMFFLFDWGTDLSVVKQVIPSMHQVDEEEVDDGYFLTYKVDISGYAPFWVTYSFDKNDKLYRITKKWEEYDSLDKAIGVYAAECEEIISCNGPPLFDEFIWLNPIQTNFYSGLETGDVQWLTIWDIPEKDKKASFYMFKDCCKQTITLQYSEWCTARPFP